LSAEADDAGFESWWQTYPRDRRVAKAKCLRLWRRKGLDARSRQVMAVLVSDIASTQWCRDDGQYIPLPMTWLLQDRFEREVVPARAEPRCRCGAPARYQLGSMHLCSEHFDEETQRERTG